MAQNNFLPDLSKVIEWSKYSATCRENVAEVNAMYNEAREFLEFYDWCLEIKQSYAGIIYPGIIAVFLFKIEPSKPEVDEWVWVIVGDIPPAYLTVDQCPNPATAIDGYIGAMMEWVAAAQAGKSVANLIPVNVHATAENAELLKARLDFLDEKILADYQEDLKD